MENLKTIIHNRNFLLRLLLIIVIIFPFFFIIDFIKHFNVHFTGSILPNVITHQWHIVILNIVMFMTFLIPLSFRRKINWKEYGLVSAFFISLFVEMYGIPLTLFFASQSFSGAGASATSNIDLPNIFYEFEFFGVNIRMTMAMTYGTILMVLGTILILIGWVTLYNNLKENQNENALVTKGIYSYSRHPQYLGFILIIIGWVIGWPTFLTLIFAPILIFMYIRVCRIEEKELSKNLKYNSYKKKVPFLL